MLKTNSSLTFFYFLNVITLCALVLKPLIVIILENQFIIKIWDLLRSLRCEVHWSSVMVNHFLLWIFTVLISASVREVSFFFLWILVNWWSINVCTLKKWVKSPFSFPNLHTSEYFFGDKALRYLIFASYHH